ncbi:MAG: hypothetical protein PHE43_03645 [Candidatus Nanoarchaeia archaeon]|nr:hypothetical protein [Candidatus Nanoarchaeia archaeon]
MTKITPYQKARETLGLVKTTLGGRDFYVFGSFARKQFDKSIVYGENSDLDIIVGSEDYKPVVKEFKKIGGIEVRASSIEVPNDGIFSKHSPSSVHLAASEITSPNYTLIHLVELPEVREAISWISPKMKTKEGVKYLMLPEKKEFTDFDREVWEHNFNHYT